MVVPPQVQCYQLFKSCIVSDSTGFEAKILHTGMVSFLLSNLSDGWTGMLCINTLSPTSRFARSTSIFGGMCSAGQRYTRLVLIFCKKPPALSIEFDSQVKHRKQSNSTASKLHQRTPKYELGVAHMKVPSG